MRIAARYGILLESRVHGLTGDMGEEARVDKGEDKVGRNGKAWHYLADTGQPSQPPQPMFQLCRSGQPSSV